MSLDGKHGKIFVNGRFLRGPITGTARVAEEVLAEWDKAILARDERFSGYSIELLCPTDIRRSLPLDAIKTRRCDLLGGKLWELVDLGLLAWGGTLVNFANISPFVHPHAVTYIHDAQMFLFPESYKRSDLWTHRPLFRLAGWNARRVITVSEFSSLMLQQFGIARASKTRVIHNGANHILRVKPEPSILQRYGLTPNEYVLMFGSAFSYKNVGVVYQAMAHLKNRKLKLAVIGRADLREAVEAGPNITVVTEVTDEGLRALYENALVFVQPARTEGFAMTQLEALNLGTPVITCQLGSMREVLGESVVYASPDSSLEWAECVARFADDPRFRSDAVERGQRMAAHYTWKRTADALWHEVCQVAGHRQGRRFPQADPEGADKRLSATAER